METRTIEQLVTTATELENDDLIPIWQDGQTKKISGTNFFKNRSSTPVDVVQDGNMHAVTSNAVADSLSYSTTETLTGGTWIDGKPIYRKVIDCGVMPNNTTKNVAHGISNIGKVIRSDGYSDNNAGIQIPVPYVSGIPLSIFVDNTNIIIQTSGDYTNYVNTYITLEYTKTTD